MYSDQSLPNSDRSGASEVTRGTLEKLQSGDESALCDVISAYQAMLFRYVISSLHSPEIAEDVLQEVFIQLWNTRERIDTSLSIRSYLYRIARNKTFDAITSSNARRTREQQVISGEESIVDSPLDELEREEFDAAIQRAISDLPDRCREIFLLARHGNMTYAEVAETLGISVSTVKTQMGRAIASLAARLSPFIAMAVIVEGAVR